MTTAQMRYLYKIYEISTKKPAVLSADIARKLNVSKPSVVKMLAVLSEKQMVVKKRYGKVSITPEGIAEAQRYERNVAKICGLIPRMGLEMSEAELRETACSLVSTLSEDTLSRLEAE